MVGEGLRRGGRGLDGGGGGAKVGEAWKKKKGRGGMRIRVRV